MRVLPCFALLALASLSAAQEREVKTSDLGATFDRVYFARPESRLDGGQRVSAATPLVGVRVDGIKLEAAILREAANRPARSVGEVPGQALLQRYRDAIAKGELAQRFLYRRDGQTGPDAWRPVRAVEKRGDHWLLILPPSESYNRGYWVRFVVGDLVIDGDGPARYRGRFNANFSTNLVRDEDQLIKGKTDASGNFVNDTAPSAYGLLSLDYQGAPNPLRGRFLRGKGYSNLNVQAVLTENQYAARSSIILSSSGVSDFGLFRVPNAMPISGFGLQTSQSLRQTTVYALEPGYRFGDLRARPGRGYLSADQAIPGIYLEGTVQLGFNQYRRISGVPDSQDLTEALVRPRVTLGLQRYLGDRSPFSVTGDVTAYYVANRLGGVLGYTGSRFPATFNLSIGVGSGSSRLTFGVVGGRNPAQNFQRIRPTYSLGLGVAF